MGFSLGETNNFVFISPLSGGERVLSGFPPQQAHHARSPRQTIDGSKNTLSKSSCRPKELPTPGTKGPCCSSLAMIPGSKTETASQGNASVQLLPLGPFTVLEGWKLSMAGSKSGLGEV